MRLKKDKATRHTLQYAGSAEDVERIKELAERFAARKKIHNRYKINCWKVKNVPESP